MNTTSPGPGDGGQKELTRVIIPHVRECPRAARLAWLRSDDNMRKPTGSACADARRPAKT